MLELLTQAAAQVPSLVVLCILVHIFVSSLKADRTAIETIASEGLDRNTAAMADNQRVIADNQRVIAAAVESINRNTEMLGRTLSVIERMDRRYDPQPERQTRTLKKTTSPQAQK